MFSVTLSVTEGLRPRPPCFLHGMLPCGVRTFLQRLLAHPPAIIRRPAEKVIAFTGGGKGLKRSPPLEPLFALVGRESGVDGFQYPEPLGGFGRRQNPVPYQLIEQPKHPVNPYAGFRSLPTQPVVSGQQHRVPLDGQQEHRTVLQGKSRRASLFEFQQFPHCVVGSRDDLQMSRLDQ